MRRLARWGRGDGHRGIENESHRRAPSRSVAHVATTSNHTPYAASLAVPLAGEPCEHERMRRLGSQVQASRRVTRPPVWQPRDRVAQSGPMSSGGERLPDWERLLAAERHLQKLVPGSVLVGGTAAAIHARHRVSLDGDHVLEDLRSRFDEVLAALEAAVG